MMAGDTRASSQTWTKILAPLGIGIGAFVLYAAFLSQMYQTDGIVEADWIENRHGIGLFNANHLLYRPVMRLLHQALIALGYAGPVLPQLQLTSALFGATGIVLFYLFLQRLTRDMAVSLLIAAVYAVSRGYWTWSTDINYAMVSVTFVLWAAYLLSDTNTKVRSRVRSSGERRLEKRHAVKLAVTSGLAILVSQVNIFLVPVITLAFLVDAAYPWRDRLRQVLNYGASLGAVVAIPYLAVGLFIKRLTALEEWVSWLVGWDAGGGVSLPLNGWFAWSRFSRGFQATIETQAPPWNGVALRALISRGSFEPERMLAGLATLLALIIVVGTLIWLLIVWPRLSNQRRLAAALCLVFFGLYTLFGIWWEPHTSVWFFTPSAGLWTITALLLTDTRERVSAVWRRNLLRVGSAVVVLLGSANFVTTIGFNHFSPNRGLEKALFVGERMQSGDLFVGVHWDWATYIPYFTGREMLSIPNMPGVPDRQAVLAGLQTEIAERHRVGHRVYIADESNPPYWGYWEDVKFNTGLNQSDVRALMGQTVWTYQDLTVRELNTPAGVGLLGR